MKTRSRAGATPSNSVEDATIAAINRVIEPLMELILDAGISLHTFNKLVRAQAVTVAMKRLKAAGTKESKSRAAIMTGLPRSEVASLLRSTLPAVTRKSEQLAKRILTAWHDDPRFSAPGKKPSVLPIFGKAASFEQLVSRHGGGTPVRAMLEELTQLQAIERLPDQKVRVRFMAQVPSGNSTRSIAAAGERGRDLLKTLTNNLRHPTHLLFEATAMKDLADRDMIFSARRELAIQGAEFIKGATSLLNQPGPKNAQGSAASQQFRIGMTVFCFEEKIESETEVVMEADKTPRKNLRRQRSTRKF